LVLTLSAIAYIVISDPPLSSCSFSSVTVTLTDGGFCTTLYHCVNN